MKKTILITSVVCFTLAISSCKKEGCTDPTAINYNMAATKDDESCEYATPTPAPTPPSYTPSFTGVYGALIAINTITTTSTPLGDMDAQVGTAVALFSENGGTTFITAGNINANSNQLTAQSNNSYVYQITTSNPTGITFSNNVSWTGTGGAWPSFSATTNQGFSTIGTVTSGNASANASYSLTANQVSNCDSVLFVIAGQGTHVTKMLPGNATSHTFTDAELATIGTGTAIVQVIGLNYDLQNIASKDYYLINETVKSKIISIE